MLHENDYNMDFQKKSGGCDQNTTHYIHINKKLPERVSQGVRPSYLRLKDYYFVVKYEIFMNCQEKVKKQ